MVCYYYHSSGSLTEELGIDMLGLKELGLGVTSVRDPLFSQSIYHRILTRILF